MWRNLISATRHSKGTVSTLMTVILLRCNYHLKKTQVQSRHNANNKLNNWHKIKVVFRINLRIYQVMEDHHHTYQIEFKLKHAVRSCMFWFMNPIYLPQKVKSIYCIQHHTTWHMQTSKTVTPSVRNIIYTHKYTVIFLFWHKVALYCMTKWIKKVGKNTHIENRPPLIL